MKSRKLFLAIFVTLVITLGVGGYLIWKKMHSTETDTVTTKTMTFAVNTDELVGGGCNYIVYDENGKRKGPTVCVYKANIEPIFKQHQADIDKFWTVNPDGSRTQKNNGVIFAKINADTTVRQGTRSPSTPNPQSIPVDYLYITNLHSIEFFSQ